MDNSDSDNNDSGSDYLYQYPPLRAGKLVKRYKRFFADVELTTGELITAHCPNTGPMTGVCTLGSPVYVSQSDNPARKLAYTLEMIQVYDNQPTWVGVNTGLPNRVTNLALTQRLIPDLGDYQTIRYEVPYGQDQKSRIDFLLSNAIESDENKSSRNKISKNKSSKSKSNKNNAEAIESKLIEAEPDNSTPNDSSTAKPTYIEVKSTTWAQGDLVLFPDTVTTRGQKHLRELIALTPIANCVMLYFINRADCPYFAPGDSADPTYGKLFREALDCGVKVLPCRFEISPGGIRYLGLAELKLSATG